MKLDDNALILTLELAEKIGCNESFLYILLKEVEQRKLQDTRTTKIIPSLATSKKTEMKEIEEWDERGMDW